MSEHESELETPTVGTIDWAEYYRTKGLDPELVATGGVEAPKGPGAAAYSKRARQIVEVLAHPPGEGSHREGLAAAAEKYMDKKGESESMQAFTKVLLDAPVAYQVAQAERQARHDLAVLPEAKIGEAVMMRRRRGKLAHQLATYKAALSDVIIESEGQIDRDNMTDWLAKTTGQEKWVQSALMPEVTAAVAVYEYFSSLDNVESVMLADPEDSVPTHWRMRDDWHMRVKMRGGDSFRVAARPQGQEPRGNVAFGHGGILEVGIPDAILDSFSVAEEARDVFDKQILRALDERDNGSTHVYRAS